MKITEQKLRKLIRQVILEEAESQKKLPSIKITPMRSLFLSACVAIAILGGGKINHEDPINTVKQAKNLVTQSRGSQEAKEFQFQFPDDHKALMSNQGQDLNSTPESMVGSQAEEMIILNQHYKRKGRRV